MTRFGPETPQVEDFVRPVTGGADPAAIRHTPLSRLPVGDFAVLAWVDDVQARWPSVAVEAELVARWDTATAYDVHTLLFTEDDTAGAQPS